MANIINKPAEESLQFFNEILKEGSRGLTPAASYADTVANALANDPLQQSEWLTRLTTRPPVLKGERLDNAYLNLSNMELQFTQLADQLQECINDLDNPLWKHFIAQVGNATDATALIQNISRTIPSLTQQLQDRKQAFYQLNDHLRNPANNFPADDIPTKIFDGQNPFNKEFMGYATELRKQGFSDKSIAEILKVAVPVALEIEKQHGALAEKGKDGKPKPADNALKAFQGAVTAKDAYTDSSNPNKPHYFKAGAGAAFLAASGMPYYAMGFAGAMLSPQILRAISPAYRDLTPYPEKEAAQKAEDHFAQTAKHVATLHGNYEELQNKLKKVIAQRAAIDGIKVDPKKSARELAQSILTNRTDAQTAANVISYREDHKKMRLWNMSHTSKRWGNKTQKIGKEVTKTIYQSIDKLVSAFAPDEMKGTFKSCEELLRSIPWIGDQITDIIAGSTPQEVREIEANQRLKQQTDLQEQNNSILQQLAAVLGQRVA